MLSVPSTRAKMTETRATLGWIHNSKQAVLRRRPRSGGFQPPKVGTDERDY